MSEKARDPRGRWRSVSVSFRVSPEENELINSLVKLSGLTKQEYLARRVTQKDMVVFPNPRVLKALKDEMVALRKTLENVQTTSDDDLLDRVLIAKNMYDSLEEKK